MQDTTYDHQKIEGAAQAHWQASDAYRVGERSDKPLGK
jgi:hypothetical protein